MKIILMMLIENLLFFGLCLGYCLSGKQAFLYLPAVYVGMGASAILLTLILASVFKVDLGDLWTRTPKPVWLVVVSRLLAISGAVITREPLMIAAVAVIVMGGIASETLGGVEA